MKDSELDAGQDRVVGCLLGGALGDALGYPVEFIRSWQAIVAAHGRGAPERLAYAHPAPALISDDTQMTLFVAEGCIRAVQRMSNRGICSPPSVILHALVRWYVTQIGDRSILDSMSGGGLLLDEPRLYAQRAPGNTNLNALALCARNERVPPNDSKGCGAVMRSAPIGLGARSIEVAWEIALESGASTHGHPSGHLSAAYFAAVVQRVARNDALTTAMEQADTLLAQAQDHQEMTQAIAAAREVARAGIPAPDALESLGEGWVGEEALAIALACALTVEGDGPEATSAALWRSVLHRGDSDSTGSLTGNLLGAMHGTRCLPPRWLHELELRDLIERVGNDLFRSAWLGEDLDTDDYPPY